MPYILEKHDLDRHGMQLYFDTCNFTFCPLTPVDSALAAPYMATVEIPIVATLCVNRLSALIIA